MTDEAVFSWEEPPRVGRGWAALAGGGRGRLDERAWHRQSCTQLQSPALMMGTYLGGGWGGGAVEAGMAIMMHPGFQEVLWSG